MAQNFRGCQPSYVPHLCVRLSLPLSMAQTLISPLFKGVWNCTSWNFELPQFGVQPIKTVFLLTAAVPKDFLELLLQEYQLPYTLYKTQVRNSARKSLERKQQEKKTLRAGPLEKEFTAAATTWSFRIHAWYKSKSINRSLLREKENNKTQSFSLLLVWSSSVPKTLKEPRTILFPSSKIEVAGWNDFQNTEQCPNPSKRVNKMHSNAEDPHFLETLWQFHKTTHVAKVSHFPEPARNSQQKPQSKKQRTQSASSDTSLTQPCSTNRKARSMQV